MRRAKLAPGSVAAGSLPTAISQTVPRCFVCDESIKSHRLSTSLLAGRTQYTHSPLPTKIGGYIGDEFVVVVTPQDALCKHCMALINTMDRLELQLRQHRYTLTQHLKTKYKLDGHVAKPVTKYEAADEDDDLQEPEIIEVSDEEWTPKKRQRTDSVKHHRCTICNASYTNLSLFMAHLSRHKQVEKIKPPTVTVLPSVKPMVSLGNNNNFRQIIKFKCGCCSETFTSKESLAVHMQLHTVAQPKPKVNCVLPTVLSKPINHQTASSVLIPKPEPVVPASTLFEDIEQLSHQEAPVSVGVCTEEQKGRVCLLALLNNGVCSDLSHRGPPESSGENAALVPSANTVTKTEDSNDEPTISITVSIPNVLNGGQLTQQQLSFSAVSNLSYPVTLSKPSATSNLSSMTTVSKACDQNVKHLERSLKIPSQNFNMSHNLDLQNSCLEMSDLCNSAFQGVAKLNNPDVGNTNEQAGQQIPSVWNSSNTNPVQDSLVDNVRNVSLVPSVPSGTHSQGMDMPSLLDEDFLQTDHQSQDTFVPTSDLSQRSSNKNTTSTGESEISPEASLISENKSFLNICGNDRKIPASVKNIAIVSVTSVPVNGGDLVAEDIPDDWFYSSSTKELSSALEEKKVNDKDSSLQGSWFHDDDIPVSSEKSAD